MTSILLSDQPLPNTQIVKREIVKLCDTDGYVTPYQVLDAARDVSSPLHAFFEWDDSAAAEAFRLIQATGLIRSVRVKVTTSDEEERSVRGFLPARIAGRELPPGAYIPQDDIVNDPAAKEAVLRQMQRDIASCKRRYEHLAEFWSTIDDLAAQAAPKKGRK